MAAAQPHPFSSLSGFDWLRLCRAGGIAAFIFLGYTLVTLVQLSILGGPPSSAAEAFQVLQQSKVIGLLRLDFLTVVALPLYYLLFLGLFSALRDTDRTHAAVATALAFVGLTLVLATPNALPLLALGEKYSAASSEAMKAHYLAAGEAVMATDMWHGTGAYLGAILLQSGAAWISVIMLRGVFSKMTAWLGIVVHTLDLIHVVILPFLPRISVGFMIIAGLGLPVWLWLVGRRLLQVERESIRD